MARPCIICSNNLSAYVRKLTQEGKMPSAIKRMVYDKYQVKLSYANIRHHVKYHDESAGTLVMATRGAQKKLAEATEIKNNALDMAKQVQKFFIKSWDLVDKIDWEDFETIGIEKQMDVVKKFGGLMKDYKRLEIDQQKLDSEIDPSLISMLKVMSRSKALTQTSVTAVEEEEVEEEEE